jgi:hypothetical protein
MTNVVQKENMRWGINYVDNRVWPVYNKQLVKRGEYLLDLDWVETWDSELRDMNCCKVGRRYKFPNSMIWLQGIWHAHKISYRAIKGITRKLHQMAQLPAYNDYSTINRRVNKLDMRMNIPFGEKLILFADGTGFQAIEGGEYLRSKYSKKNRRWVQVIILGDPEKKEPVSFKVNLVPKSEPDNAKTQIDDLIKAGVEIEAFGGDGGFDKLELWNYLKRKRIRPIIKPDKNARDDSSSNWRNINVKCRNKSGYKEWARITKYGTRWPATEGIFSAIKRMFGEQLHARSEIGMTQEAKMKVLVRLRFLKKIENYLQRN